MSRSKAHRTSGPASGAEYSKQREAQGVRAKRERTAVTLGDLLVYVVAGIAGFLTSLLWSCYGRKQQPIQRTIQAEGPGPNEEG